MTKEPEPYLRTIIDSMLVVVERVPDDKAKFLADGILQDATLMRLLETGEQLIQLRDKFPGYYDKHQTDSWHRLIGLRNIIAHGYREIDVEEIWKTVTADVPEFINELQHLV